MNDREIAREIPFEEKAAHFKENVSNYFSTHVDNGGDTDDAERLLIHEGYRAVLSAEKTIHNLQAKIKALQMDNQQLQSDITNANQNLDHMTERWESARKIIHRTTIRYCDLRKELLAAQEDLETAVAETIIAFAERLKTEMENCAKVENSNGDYFFLIAKSLVDGIAEEMAGDAE